MKKTIRKEQFDSNLPFTAEHVLRGTLKDGELHTNEFSELILCLGNGTHICGGKRVPLRFCNVLLVNAGTCHGFGDCDTLEFFKFTFDPSRPIPILMNSNFTLVREMYPPKDGTERDEAFPLGSAARGDLYEFFVCMDFIQYELKRRRLGYEVLVTMRFAEIVTYCERELHNVHEDSSNIRMEQAINLLENAPLQRRLNLRMLAHAAGTSVRTFMRAYKKQYKKTPIRSRLRQKLIESAVLLRDTNLTITEIALQKGFCDSSNFAVQFKKMTGMPPKEFRKSRNPIPGENPFF